MSDTEGLLPRIGRVRDHPHVAAMDPHAGDPPIRTGENVPIPDLPTRPCRGHLA